MFNSKAVTKVQSIVLISIIIVVTLGGIIYLLAGNEEQTSETIKIGICADLNNVDGKAILRGAILAAEQINAEGGLLGKDFEIVSEDDDSESANLDITIASNALTRLITVDKADFILAGGGFPNIAFQDISAEHKKILLLQSSSQEDLTQRVLDDYGKYKYFFRSGIPNSTSAIEGTVESVLIAREHTGFNKVAVLYHDLPGFDAWFSTVIETLIENDFEVVYEDNIPMDILDFSSYFAHAEAAGAEILFPLILGSAGISFVNEYYVRQSPMIMWGGIGVGSTNDFWELTEGKCEYISNTGYPVVTGYPLTSKTTQTREAYLERWGEDITSSAAAAYDTIKFILFNTIEKADTIETESVISALENIDVETSLARHFIFTRSHDVFIGKAGPNRPTEDYMLVAVFQWQNGVQVPVYPIELMQEAGVSYTFPDWPGPWNNID